MTPKRILAAYSLLVAVAAAAWAEPKPGPLERLPAEKLRALAPMLRTTDLALIESNEKGMLKQLTTMSYVAAPPETVREVVIHPERYGEFVRNTKECTVKKLPDGKLFHSYAVGYTIYTVDGRHIYTFPPHDPSAGKVAPVHMYDADDNGVRHYRWEFHEAAGGGTVLVLYGFTVIPRDGFLSKFLNAAPTLEFGLALIPQLTLELAIKARAEQLAPSKPAPPTGSMGGYEFMLARGTVALLRSAGGRLSDLSLVDRTTARPEVVVKVAGEPTQWSQFVPTLRRTTTLGAKDGVAGVEVEQKLPLMSWTTTWAYRVSATAADLFAVAGDLRGGRMRWDVRPTKDGATELVLRAMMAYDRSSMVVRQLYKLEPYFEYGIDLGLGLLYLQGVRQRAEQLTRSQAAR